MVINSYRDAVEKKGGKVMADAFYTALAAFIFGMYLARTIKQYDRLKLAGCVFLGAFVIFGVFWTRHAVRRLTSARFTTSASVKRSARQVVVFCIAVAATSLTLGLEVKVMLNSPDNYYVFSSVSYGLMTALWVFCFHREVKRLTSFLV
jgi:hypothetical protein